MSEATTAEHVYPCRYFALQLTYAEKVAAVLGSSLDDVLLDYTSLYNILGIADSFDAQQPIWRDAVQRANGANAAHQLHCFYLSRFDTIPRFTDEQHWGCFAYEYRPVAFGTLTNAIRIHVASEDTSGRGTLSRDRMSVRLAELRAMFAYIAEHEPQATTVCGGSLLYNREAYRRLFPPALTSSLVVDEPRYQYRALWGQFLHHDWTVNEELAGQFLERVANLAAAGQVASCFPYAVLLTTCPITEFYSFYDLTPTASRG